MKSHHLIKKPHLPKADRTSLRAAVKGRFSKPKNSGVIESLSDLPRITNETVAEHREAVLKGARKYIYPLQHSRGGIIKVSIILFIVAVVAFFTYCGLALYKFHSTSTFVYEVTRVIPFPIAKAGSQFVSYESYLFELRHLTHYYETQQKQNFDDPRYAEQLVQLKKDSLQKVIDDAFIKQLADNGNITVSSREVSDQIGLVKSQNRLGSSDSMLEDVLKQFWGWSLDDFRRELKSQLLSQKVASSLDTATHARATNTLAELQGGADFTTVAAQASDDAESKARGGQYIGPIGKTDRDVPPRVIDALFRLSAGQISDIVDTGYSLEILKNISVSGEKIQAAHISFKLEPIQTYTQPLEKQQPIHRFIKA